MLTHFNTPVSHCTLAKNSINPSPNAHTHTLPDSSDTHTHLQNNAVSDPVQTYFVRATNKLLVKSDYELFSQADKNRTDRRWLVFCSIFVAVFVPVLVEEHHFYLPSSKPGGVWSGKGQSSSKNPEVA